MILFSIILPTYNRSHKIGRTIDSVLSQIYDNWELIIIDDGSTDNTKEVLIAYIEKDSRIKYIYQENQERSAARNNGIKQALGNYICFLDSDDEYLPHHLSTLNIALEKQNFTGLLNTQAYIKSTAKSAVHPQKKFELNDLHPISYFWLNNPCMSSVCCNREILLDYKFDERFYIGEDLHLWLRILGEYPYLQINKPTANYNTEDENTMMRLNFDLEKMKNFCECLSDLLKKEIIINRLNPKDKYKLINNSFSNFIFKNLRKGWILNFFSIIRILLQYFPNRYFIPDFLSNLKNGIIQKSNCRL